MFDHCLRHQRLDPRLPCAENCSNFEAEALAIKAAIEIIEENLEKNTYQNLKVIIFTDAKSVQ